MKKSISLFAAAIAALLLASCYQMSIQPTGTINLNFGGGTAGRAISSTAKVRVYLYTYKSTNNYSLFTFPSGKTYTEFSYGSGTQTLTDIPVGLWQVLVSVGSDGPSGTEAFYTQQYGASQIINVVAGVDSSASVTTKTTPFVYSQPLAGQDLNGVVFDYSYSVASDFPSLMVASASALYGIVHTAASPPATPDLTTDPPVPVPGLPSGLQINSLSESLWEFPATGPTFSVFINSNQGIVPYNYFGINSTYSGYLTGTSGNPLDILGASSVLDSSGNVALYYYRANGIGGAYLTSTNIVPANSTTTGANWVDIALSGSTSGSSIYDLAVDQNSATSGYAYYATAQGAFRAGPSLVTYPGPGGIGNVVSINAPNNETIQSIAVDGYDNVIYIGTPQGAYYATLNEASATSAISGSWTPIAATTGDDIVSIKTDKSTTDTLSGYNPYASTPQPEAVAFRSSYNLYVMTGPPALGGTVTTYPFFAGLPGTAHAMDFAYGMLYVAGSEGLVSVLVHTPGTPF